MKSYVISPVYKEKR